MKKVSILICILQKKEKNMLKITTPTKAEELYEVAQEYPFPMIKRALAALKNGENIAAESILEELLGFIDTEQELKLWQYLRELTELVTLWLHKSEKDGTWLTRIDKIREKIMLISCQQSRFDEKYLREHIELNRETVKNLVLFEMPDANFTMPSYEDIFIVAHDWRAKS
jgi:hypothetical protein